MLYNRKRLGVPRTQVNAAYIIDSSEPYAMYLSEDALRRTCGCRCVGWRDAVRFDAHQRLIRSDLRFNRCRLKDRVSAPLS